MSAVTLFPQSVGPVGAIVSAQNKKKKKIQDMTTLPRHDILEVPEHPSIVLELHIQLCAGFPL